MAKKSENRHRQKRLTVRFNEQELEALQDRADQAGLSCSGYLRHTILQPKPPRQSHRPVKDHEKLARLLGAIGRIGNNINQLAHVANAGSWPEHQSLELASRQIQEIRDMLIQSLGRQSVEQPVNEPIDVSVSGNDP